MHIRDRVLSRLFTDGPCVGHGVLLERLIPVATGSAGSSCLGEVWWLSKIAQKAVAPAW